MLYLLASSRQVFECHLATRLIYAPQVRLRRAFFILPLVSLYLSLVFLEIFLLSDQASSHSSSEQF